MAPEAKAERPDDHEWALTGTTTGSKADLPAPAPEWGLLACDYCHGIGACPKCWGRTAIEEFKAQLLAARDEIERLKQPLNPAERVVFANMQRAIRDVEDAGVEARHPGGVYLARIIALLSERAERAEQERADAKAQEYYWAACVSRRC